MNAKVCGTCQHAGPCFKLPLTGNHVHCGHPDANIADDPPKGQGWGTLRRWYEKRNCWTQKVKP